jgi:hypothetical protein
VKIFFPFQKDANTYFDEIINCSDNEFVFDNYKNYNSEYKIVNIHWPESIFNWAEPTNEQLNDYENEIFEWKKHSKIIYTVHNLNPHSGITKNFTKLYKIIEQNCDVFMHLGEFSKNYFQKRYPKSEHIIINHPLYETTFRVSDKKYARNELGIDEKVLVIIAPGKIRNLEEKKMVLRAFNSINEKNKVLISTNMLRDNISINFPGRYTLKKFIDLKLILEKLFHKKYSKPKYFFNEGYLNSDKFSLMMSASDIVFIPRKKILNSGNVFLGLTYKKIIVGPSQGNVKEILENFGFPIFDSNNSKSVFEALKQSVFMFKDNCYQYKEEYLAKFKPKNVAEEWDKLIDDLSRN